MIKRQEGFTLIELLVVILIISILAAIAIPFFLVQRRKGYEAQSRSVLKDAATAAESYAIDNLGDYTGLDGKTDAFLTTYGYRPTTNITITLAGDKNQFCVTATHVLLAGGAPPEPWYQSTYSSSLGFPSPSDSDTC